MLQHQLRKRLRQLGNGRKLLTQRRGPHRLARQALSPEYMRKAAAAMFEKASVAQQNATQLK